MLFARDLKHISRSFSDHSPPTLIFTFSPVRRKKIFRFENFWLDFVDYLNAVKNAWNFSPYGNPMHVFSHLLYSTCSKLRIWSSSGIDNLESAITRMEAEINSLELSDSDL